jgi:hypothetical protein
VSRTIGVGLGLTTLVTAMLVAFWGRPALVPGVTFGLLATGLQYLAVRTVEPAMERPIRDFTRRWAAGIGFRMSAILVFTALVALWPEMFPPLPSAFGLLGVLVPLLFMEIRLSR